MECSFFIFKKIFILDVLVVLFCVFDVFVVLFCTTKSKVSTVSI